MYEIVTVFLEDRSREIRIEIQIQPFTFCETILVHQTCDEHGSEERSRDTNDQGNGKSSDGSCTEDGQDDTGDDRCQVRVENG